MARERAFVCFVSGFGDNRRDAADWRYPAEIPSARRRALVVPSDPSGKKFQLPAVVANCAVQKGRFLGDITILQRRAGGPMLSAGRFYVEDNRGNREFEPGASFDANFLGEYDGRRFYDWREPFGVALFHSRDNPDTLLQIGPGDWRPPATVWVCAFKRARSVALAYFLTRSPPVPL